MSQDNAIVWRQGGMAPAGQALNCASDVIVSVCFAFATMKKTSTYDALPAGAGCSGLVRSGELRFGGGRGVCLGEVGRGLGENLWAPLGRG